MAKVTGVGGVFLRSADPKALGAWYAKHLGVEVGDYVWIDPNRMNESYGRFAWIKDCDGNRVELWQPLET